MKDEAEKFPILRVADREANRIEGTVVRELSLTIFLNDEELVTLLCSPTNLTPLAAGFLLSEGLISHKGDIQDIRVEHDKGRVHVETKQREGSPGDGPLKRLITSGGGRGPSFRRASDGMIKAKVASDIDISPHEVFCLMDEFVQRSELYKATGGVHSAALCASTCILLFADDIGRHNAIDKIFGQCILKDIATTDSIILTSGRISSEILLKVAGRNIPVVISKSAPTDLAVGLAIDFGITLIGFVRGKCMNVYTNEWRVRTHGT